MFKWIGCLIIGILFLPNIQGIKNKSYIWRIAGLKGFVKLDSTEKKIISSYRNEVFKILEEKLDFRYEIVTPIASIFESKEKNGTWTGMVNQIASNKADISTIPIFITYNRFRDMDFPTSISFQQIHFIVKIGDRESNWNSIIRPFSFELWIALFILTILFGILLHQVTKCESSIETGSVRSFSTVIWYLFGTLAFQGGNLKKVYRIPSRFPIALWLLSVVILVSSYSGNLMSFMTSPVFQYVPTTFDELASSVQNGKFACGTTKGTAFAIFLMNSKTGNSKIFEDHMVSHKTNSDDFRELVARVLKGKFAFLGPHSALARIRKHEEFEKFLISEDSLVTFSASYGLRKGFPYKKELDKTLSRLFQSGIINKFYKYGPTDERESISEVRQLTIRDFLSPFALLIIGYILSITCLIVELIIDKLIRL